MKSSCLKHTVIPGTSRLFSDFIYHFDRVSGFYSADPFEPSSYREAAEQIQYPESRRKELVDALSAQNPGSAVADLAAPGTVAVVTGQQVGLFSGPAYTIFKALTAVRLARRLSDQGIRAVPIFWLATEDHDLDEVDHAWVFNRDAVPAKLTAGVRRHGGAGHAGPVGSAVLEDVPLRELAEGLGDLPYAAEVVAMVRESYQPGKTLGAAFRELLGTLLRDLGVLFLDPLDPAIRRIAAPFLAEAVLRADWMNKRLRERNAELEAAGYHAQVNIEANTSPVFLLDRGRRTTLKLRDGNFATKERTYTPSELRDRPADISPNALLRPVMQDYLLPTVAYVGGPAEVAYMAQAQVLYQELLGRMPIIVPRNGFTLLDHRGVKLLSRYHLQAADLLDYEERVRSRIAEKLVPAGIADQFRASQTVAEQQLSCLRSTLAAFDPTLESAAAKSTEKIRYQFEKLARKAARQAINGNAQALRDANYLLNLVYPHRHLQERFYTILPFLAKYGPGLIQNLLDKTQLDCPDHMIRAI